MLTHDFVPQRIRVRFLLTLLFIICCCGMATAQQRRNPPVRAQKPVSAGATPTFETLLAADSYKIYGEVRGVGQLIRSNTVNELLEPVMKLTAPPKEFKTLTKWLNVHADAVMTSRMLVAAWPTAQNVPSLLVAIEFSSPEEAAKFEPQLNDFLPRILPTQTPEATPNEGAAENREKTKPPPPAPAYFLKRTGDLVLITPTPLVLKNLRPAGSKALSDDNNFRIARDRFSSESIFVFVDYKSIAKEQQERTKQYEETASPQESNVTTEPNAEPSPEPTPEGTPVQTETPEPGTPTPPVEEIRVPNDTSNQGEQKPSPGPDPITLAMNALTSSIFSLPGKMPDAFGIALALDDAALEARVLLIQAPGEKSDAVPFLPILIPGPPIAPSSPTILPADTELFVVMSLDLAQMYAAMSKPERPQTQAVIGQVVKGSEQESPFASIERTAGIKIKEDLLPLLGNEVVLSMPVTQPTPGKTPDSKDEKPTTPAETPTPVIALSLRDKEGMRNLLPKMIDSMLFKGAHSLAQVDRRGDTEIFTYAKALSYAFVGDFLILSGDAKSTAHVVESYLRSETLSSDLTFKNYTRWQPRQLQGQVYVSPALMDSYKTWAQEPSEQLSDQVREFLSRLTVVPQPITYSLSNDGLGVLHEVHIPKNLVLMAVVAMSAESNPPPMLANERSALSAIYAIAQAETEFRKGKGGGNYATLDQLLEDKEYLRRMIENNGYRIELTVSGTRFEVSAVPIEYGKTGRVSYFVDESRVVRAGDHGGGPATIADKPIIQ